VLQFPTIIFAATKLDLQPQLDAANPFEKAQVEQRTCSWICPAEVTNMYKTIILLAVVFAVAGCSSTRDRDRLVSTAPNAALMAPQSVVREAPIRVASQAPADPSIASLQPGPTYVASFPEADRRAACERLDYQKGTRAFSKCLEGDFPENPYFAQSGN
jgi:hypothetical protein